jgi:chromosome segregation ATPase
MTFIPLDTIQAKTIPDRLRALTGGGSGHLPPGIREGSVQLALDVVRPESPDLLPAFRYACGTALVCDTLATARNLSYDLDVKAKGSRNYGD